MKTKEKIIIGSKQSVHGYFRTTSLNFPRGYDLDILIEKCIKAIDLTLIRTITEYYPEQGLTIVALLKESHMTLETFPEYNHIEFSIMSCKYFDSYSLQKIIEESINVKELNIQSMIKNVQGEWQHSGKFEK